MIGTFTGCFPDVPFVGWFNRRQWRCTCVIEAMKLFNEIESEVSGKIVKILVDDISPVEQIQSLFWWILPKHPSLCLRKSGANAEIALRVIRTWGNYIKTVAVFLQPSRHRVRCDKRCNTHLKSDSLRHSRSSRQRKSPTPIPRLILSEREFSRSAASNIKFIGASPEMIEAMGDKLQPRPP